jgi:ADP-dependent NAD(P)H-hydrate dehydratase / NAD(P)H-hydrate epimerase
VIPVLSRDEMRAFDAYAIRSAHVPGLVLMENAGRGAADVVAREALGGRAEGARVVVLCGTGNNGGDGFVIARHLASRGAVVEAFLAGRAERVKGDARTNLEAWTGIGGKLTELGDDANAAAALEAALAQARVGVDALFGTGLDRALGGEAAHLVAVFNRAPVLRVAVDLPSGLDANTGRPLGACVEAHLTATFARHKLGLLTPGGARYAGRIFVCDLGVPAALGAATHSADLLERGDIEGWLAPRLPDAHKGSAGHIAVLAGSAGKTGAALLVARAALRAGAGLATIVTWPDAADSLDVRVLEIMTARLDPARPGPSLDAELVGKRAVVVGPGFGLDAKARAAVDHVIATWQGPLVLDADALTLLAGRLETLAGSQARAILTPHPGELARLLGTTTEAVESDRLAAVREASTRSRAVVLLKGAHTLVATDDGRVAVNPTGNSALATAGAGDVLSGVTGALACTLEPWPAACAAAYLHGLAADEWRAAGADRGLLASEIADRLPQLIGALTAAHTHWRV